jgi:cupin fold WbuC family metalloprotein
MSTIFLRGLDIIEVTEKELQDLKDTAVRAPLKRARLCLHDDHDDPVQEMVIAFHRTSYCRPHRHLNKSESFHVIEGQLGIWFFDDDGNVKRQVTMGEAGSGLTRVYRLARDWWHTVVPLSEITIIHETTTGPFKHGGTEYPKWAPEDHDHEGIRQFLDRLTA